MKFKKWMGVCVMASMVLSQTPVTVFAQESTFEEVQFNLKDTKVREVSSKDELVNALNEAKSGDTIQLMADIEVEETLNIIGNKKITLDIHGNDLTLKKGTNQILINVGDKSGSDSSGLLLMDSAPVKGKIESSESKNEIIVRPNTKMVTRDINIVFSDTNHKSSNSAIQVQGELTVETGTNIQSSEGGIFVLQNGSKLNVNGGEIVAEYYAVSGNGKQSGTEININEGTLKANNGAGIYHPQGGTLTLNGGTITGFTGVQMCAGQLYVPQNSTVHVIANGIDNRENKEGDGNIDDGRAISLINRGYDGGMPSAKIAGGSFVSEKTDEAILAYSWSGDNGVSDWKEASDHTTVSGGQFNQPFDPDFVKDAAFFAVDDTYYVTNKKTASQMCANAKDSIVILKNIDELTNIPGGVTVENNSDQDVKVNGDVIKEGETISIPTSSNSGSGIPKEELHPVYRAYNPNSGEHLYTVDEFEYKRVVSLGWHDEGIAFMAQEEKEGTPLFRLYNPNEGLHHYTQDEKERDALVALGWKNEEVAWYTSKKPMHHPVYRLYNPNDGHHHYTIDAHEKDVLVSLGWNFEGIAFRTAPISK